MSTPRCPGGERLTARATVRAASPARLDLELAPAQPCAGCKGLCLWSLRRRPARIVVPNRTGHARPGDQLLLSVSAQGLLKAALIAYGLPLLSMLAGAMLLGTGGSDGLAVLGALLGLLIGLPAGARLQRGLIGRLVNESTVEPMTPP